MWCFVYTVAFLDRYISRTVPDAAQFEVGPASVFSRLTYVDALERLRRLPAST